MPVKIRKLPRKRKYRVYNPETKRVYARETTEKKAKIIQRIVAGSKYKKF